MGLEEIISFLVKSNDLVVIGSTLAGVLIFLAMKLSGSGKKNLENSVNDAKTDLVTGLHASYEKQFELLNSRVQGMDVRIMEMSDLIHRQQVKLTRLQVLVIQLNSLLQTNGVNIPKYVQDEITQLTEGA